MINKIPVMCDELIESRKLKIIQLMNEVVKNLLLLDLVTRIKWLSQAVCRN